VDQGRFTDRIHVEPDIEAAAMVEEVSPVKDKGRLFHRLENLPEIELTVEIPFGEKGDGVAPLRGERGIFAVTDLTLDSGKIAAGVLQRLRIGDDELGPFLKEPPFALKAKPHRQIFFPDSVLNIAPSMFWMKRSCW
jgi:hypothetical protein